MSQRILITGLALTLALWVFPACNKKGGKVHYRLKGTFHSQLNFKMPGLPGPFRKLAKLVSCDLQDGAVTAGYNGTVNGKGKLQSVTGFLRQFNTRVVNGQGKLKKVDGKVLSNTYGYVETNLVIHYPQVTANYNSFRVGSARGDCKVQGGMEMIAKIRCILPGQNKDMVSAKILNQDLTDGRTVPTVTIKKGKLSRSKISLINGCYFQIQPLDDENPIRLNTNGFLKLVADY